MLYDPANISPPFFTACTLSKCPVPKLHSFFSCRAGSLLVSNCFFLLFLLSFDCLFECLLVNLYVGWFVCFCKWSVAIDVHRIIHHDSTSLTTRASGLGWTSAGLPHIQGVHRNLRTNPVDPSSPLQKLTHTITLIVSCILHSIGVCFCPHL